MSGRQPERLWKHFTGLALALVVTICTFSAFDASADCTSKVNAVTLTKVRSYMAKKGLIHEGDESDFPELGIKTHWDLVKALPAPNGSCMVVASLCNFSGETRECVNAFEVFGLKEDLAGDQVVDFESLYEVPSHVIAKIGDRAGEDPSFYYAHLTGKDAIEATKSLVAKIPYPGFSGLTELGKKASFDPTPNRNWTLVEAHFSLRRGETAEVLDIPAFQFDGFAGAAEAYWKGCMQPDSKFGRCSVAPWVNACVLEIKSYQL